MELAKREDAGEDEEAKNAQARIRANACSVAEYIGSVGQNSDYPKDALGGKSCSVSVEGIGGAKVVMSFHPSYQSPMLCTTTAEQDRLLLSLSQEECYTIVKNIEQVRNFLSVIGEQNVYEY